MGKVAAAIFGAFASIGGGLINSRQKAKEQDKANKFAEKQAERQTQVNRENYQTQRKDTLSDTAAQNQRDDTAIQRKVADGAKVGLSPLASIGATTGGGGFAQPASFSGAGQATPNQATGETGNYIGDALKELLTSATAREKDNLENDLLRAQIRQTNAGALAEEVKATSRSVISRAAHPTRGPKLGTQKQIQTLGWKWPHMPKTSDEQDVEDVYGDVAGNIYGVGRFLGDSALGAHRAISSWFSHHDQKQPLRHPGQLDFVKDQKKLTPFGKWMYGKMGGRF